ncbi:hypothetical protein CDL15_Pgr025630 [Punica granatum]|uniref:Uncharacterized protein n=1 Tax=Punica granatum TaxID=22663 RepID=A0A218WC52_PUNGR|nr:hypothetical protein CDL15_Pgr025630 [Punica granatum]
MLPDQIGEDVSTTEPSLDKSASDAARSTGMTSYPLMDEDIKLGGRRYFEDWCGQVDRKTSGGIQFGKCLRSWNLQFIFGCWTTSKV